MSGIGRSIMIGKDLKNGIRTIMNGAGGVAEGLGRETERIGLKIQIDKIENEIRSSCRKLGKVSFEKISNGAKDLDEDEEIKNIIDEIYKVSLKKQQLLAEREI